MAAEHGLDPVELLFRHDRIVVSPVHLARVGQIACVEGVLEQGVHPRDAHCLGGNRRDPRDRSPSSSRAMR